MKGAAAAPAPVQPMCRMFRGEPDQVPFARDFVKRHLAERHNCPKAALDDIALCVTEAVTNAIRHSASGTGGHFTVILRVDGSAARVEVIDDGPPQSPREDPGEDDALAGGLGLRLVSAHSDRMGFDEVGRYGVAWFERTWRPADLRTTDETEADSEHQ